VRYSVKEKEEEIKKKKGLEGKERRGEGPHARALAGISIPLTSSFRVDSFISRAYKYEFSVERASISSYKHI